MNRPHPLFAALAMVAAAAVAMTWCSARSAAVIPLDEREQATIRGGDCWTADVSAPCPAITRSTCGFTACTDESGTGDPFGTYFCGTNTVPLASNLDGYPRTRTANPGEAGRDATVTTGTFCTQYDECIIGYECVMNSFGIMACPDFGTTLFGDFTQGSAPDGSGNLCPRP